MKGEERVKGLEELNEREKKEINKRKGGRR